jgi:hypothetical protein
MIWSITSRTLGAPLLSIIAFSAIFDLVRLLSDCIGVSEVIIGGVIPGIISLDCPSIMGG